MGHIHTSTGPGEGRHSHSPDTERRPENSLYERQSRQGERVVEDGNGQTCLLRPASSDTETWTNQNSTISDSNIIALDALLHTKSTKDLPDMRSKGAEPIYWTGTESGLTETQRQTS